MTEGSSVDPVLAQAVEQMELPKDGLRAWPVAGGDTHRAFRVEPSAGERLFIKVQAGEDPGVFRREGQGLEALRQALAGQEFLFVPKVRGAGRRWIALSWIQQRPGEPTPLAAARLGAGLAIQHRTRGDRYGWAEDNEIGALVQANGWSDAGDGAARFFVERRIRPLQALGLEWSASLHVAIDRFCERAEEILPGSDERPSLVHGDLWSGNWICDHEGKPWLVDPAVHYGHRESDLAMSRLFGGFPAAFYDAYQANAPLAPGWKERVAAWNLYPLLVHSLMFRGAWPERALAAARVYA